MICITAIYELGRHFLDILVRVFRCLSFKVFVRANGPGKKKKIVDLQ